ncbi:TerB N-terminal domain-containing protein [Kribbella deserti]|uniref:TerB N-terminal domain-containing protein n=1 Tax=Kribbella deserti TaxID=1926257 RepID=A0ABV6QEW5_9ACTN
MTPEARATYLQWLGSGRNDPSAYVGYVLLFFYGIERRVLIGMANDPMLRCELPLLRAEVQRLHSIYHQPDAEAVHAQSDRVVDALAEDSHRDRSPRSHTRRRARVHAGLPKEAWPNIFNEHLNREIRRRSDVVGIFLPSSGRLPTSTRRRRRPRLRQA